MDTATAIAKRDAAIEQVDRNADQEWKEVAWQFLCDYAAAHPTVFCDDLWKAGLPRPREARALGALMRRAHRSGVLVATGQYHPSVHSNMTPKPVWRSGIYQPPAN